jgi:hypothetical protein
MRLLALVYVRWWLVAVGVDTVGRRVQAWIPTCKGNRFQGNSYQVRPVKIGLGINGKIVYVSSVCRPTQQSKSAALLAAKSPPFTEDDVFRSDLDKWNAMCGEKPDLSLEDRMKQLGTLVGPECRRSILISLRREAQREDNELDAFLKEVDDFVKNNLKVQTSVLDSKGMPSPKNGKLTDPTFKDACMEWYKQQEGVPEELSEEIMDLFTRSTTLKALTQASDAETLYRFVIFSLIDETLTNSFITFLKSAPFDKSFTTQSQAPSLEVSTAFQAEYVDANKAVDDFIAYIDDCQAEYKAKPGLYNSPYISLCQSSGYGKSRLLEQVSKKRNLLYVCVGDSRLSYPRPNDKARSFLFATEGSEDDRRNHLQNRLSQCLSWCLQNDLREKNQFGDNPATFWDDIIAHEPTLDSYDKQNQKTIWIAFDEARSLLSESKVSRASDFCILRRALRGLSTKIGYSIFAILVDTKPTISNFSPSQEMDPSDRPGDGEGMNLFHPYLLLLTQDALKESRLGFDDEWSFVSCGRPLWKSLYSKPSTSSAEMYTYAANKLRMSKNQLVEGKLSLLAIMLCRTGAYLSPQSSTASELAANHMATLLLTDCSHEHFLVTYLSDPVLAIASAQMWYENNLLVTKGLPILRQQLLHGAALEGYLGELVGRLLLLIGMDKASKGGYYDGKWYKVSEFMEQCFGITDCLVGEEAYMGFSHFIPFVNEPSTYSALKDLLRRRGACCLPSGEKGIDLLIPFWKKTQTEPLISSILIQVKNKEKRENGKNMRDKMNPKVCFAKGSELQVPLTDIILIMMEVGISYKRPPRSQPFATKMMSGAMSGRLLKKAANSEMEKRQSQSQNGWKKWVYSVRGIYPQAYPFLDGQAKLRDELLRLSKGWLDLDEWMACDETQNTPPTSPGLARRKEHIIKMVLNPSFDENSKA